MKKDVTEAVEAARRTTAAMIEEALSAVTEAREKAELHLMSVNVDDFNRIALVHDVLCVVDFALTAKGFEDENEAVEKMAEIARRARRKRGEISPARKAAVESLAKTISSAYGNDTLVANLFMVRAVRFAIEGALPMPRLDADAREKCIKQVKRITRNSDPENIEEWSEKVIKALARIMKIHAADNLFKHRWR